MNIAIIGAGPRGIIMAEHLLRNNSNLNIDIFDPNGIGGKVWQVKQDANLIMNTSAEQVQILPNQITLMEWGKSEAKDFILSNGLIPDDLINDLKSLIETDYSTRRLCGAYLKWGFQKILDNNPNANLNFHQGTITSIKKTNNKFNIQSETKTYSVDNTIVTIDPATNYPSADQSRLSDFAKRNELNLITPNYPTNVNFENIPPQKNVIIRGLGLNFFDYLTLLTKSRGGKYKQNNDGSLEYEPSGKEPKIIVGSRRGVPYYPKPINQDGKINSYRPIFTTEDNVNKSGLSGSKKYERFTYLFRLEMELKYYTLLFEKIDFPIDIAKFRDEFIHSKNPHALIESLSLAKKYQLDWKKIQNPQKSFKYQDINSYQDAISNWLKEVIDDAELGSQTAPLTAAFALNHSMRYKLREIFADSDNEFKKLFLTDFMRKSNFLAMGAPAIRLRQLSALMNKGIVKVLPPDMQIVEDDQFVAGSANLPNQSFSANTLIEAQLPKIDLINNRNPLIRQLVDDNLITNADLGTQATLKSVKINPSTYQVIDKNNVTNPNLFVFGSLTEGTKIVTNVIPQSGVDDNQDTAETISQLILNN